MNCETKFEYFSNNSGLMEATDGIASLDDVDGDELNSDTLFDQFRERFLLTDIQEWQQARSVWQWQSKIRVFGAV